MKKKINLKVIFGVVFVLLSAYILLVESELYESKTVIMVRDLSASVPEASLGLALLGVGPSSQLQDSKVVEEYLLSLDVFLKLNKEFDLVKHYKSDNLDFVQRLSENADMEEMLEFYHKRLSVNYDEISGLLHISYAHTDSKKAQEILKFLVSSVEDALNEFNRRKAKKQLSFIELEYDKKRKAMQHSAEKLEAYQNEHSLLDPSNEASSSSSIIASLEAMLSQKKIELSTKNSYLNTNNYEIVTLRNEIKEIKKSLKSSKKSLADKDAQGLNKILFEYNQLKMQFEFDTEVYKSALMQLERLRVSVLQAAKTLSVVSNPNLPDGYTYPNKPRDMITLIVAMLLMYGIASMLSAIIKDHRE